MMEVHVNPVAEYVEDQKTKQSMQSDATGTTGRAFITGFYAKASPPKLGSDACLEDTLSRLGHEREA